MAKRPKYKQLYLHEQHTVAVVQGQLAVVQQELREINEVLVPHGQDVLEAFGTPDSSTPLKLNALHFISARAFLEAGSRFESPLHRGGFTSYTYHGQPLQRAA